MSFFYGGWNGALAHLYQSVFGRRRLAPNLVTLPTELHFEVLELLEWDDILCLRGVCKCLYDLSKTRRIWLYLFKHYAATVFPKPFPLPKPLQYCSRNTLEGLVCEYFRYSKELPQRLVRARQFTPPLSVWQSYLLPGGRWAILSHCNGSLSYLDFHDDDLKATPLTPPPWEVGSDVFIALAVDIDHDSETLAFNIAIAFHMEESDGINQEVHVWSVAVDYNSNWDAVGLSATLLSAFPEDPLRSIDTCSLHGDYVAYRCQDNVSIVNWREVNGPRAQFSRRVLRCLGDYCVLSPRWLFNHCNGTSELWDIQTAPIAWKSLSFEAPGGMAACVWRHTSAAVVLKEPWLKRFSKPGYDVFVLPGWKEYEAIMIPVACSLDATTPMPVCIPLTTASKQERAGGIPSSYSYGYKVTLKDDTLHFLRFPWPGVEEARSQIRLDKVPANRALRGFAQVDIVPTRVLFSLRGNDCVYLEFT
ncbi:hypothetical protein BKA70DRAFT_1278581 [Coprinopsis sp. MPI-PUGE-AT-0042]|nr:hypothetical protein BKA70DRAFT_1278581 [Coprinopsis sp. MPI-PUGE-AT-0042]